MKFYKTALALTATVFAAAACTSPAAEAPEVQPQAAASAAPSRASLEELFAVQDFDKIMDESFKRIPAAVAASLPDISGERRAEVSRVLGKYLELMYQEVNTPETRGEIRTLAIDAAAKTYTQAEVDALVKFYKSPEGRSAMVKTPQYMEAVMVPMSRIMQPKIQAWQQKYGAQMAREINQAACGKNACPKQSKK